jgi:hypothetical protein
MFDGHYEEWQISRINCIEKYIGFDFFKNKSLHEIGCGYSYFGNYLSKYCSIVSVSDARKEHIDVVNGLYPKLKTSIIDVDGKFETEHSDILIDFGVLYHIKNIKEHMESLTSYDYVILETEVCDSLGSECIFVDESGYDQSFNGIGIRPSEKMIESILNENNFNYLCVKDSILNSSHHFYDWNIEDSGNWKSGYRRFWICWNKKVKSPIII